MEHQGITLPDNLHPVAEAFIKTLIDNLADSGRLVIIYAASLYCLAATYSLCLKALDEVDADGMTQISGRGNVSVAPALKNYRDLSKDLLDMCKQFGSTLASRGKIKEVAQTTEESPIEALLRQTKR